MFEDKLTAQFGRLKAELDGALYRRYALQRELDRLEEDILRMEAGLAELEHVRKDWEAHKAIEEAQANKTKKE